MIFFILVVVLFFLCFFFGGGEGVTVGGFKKHGGRYDSCMLYDKSHSKAGSTSMGVQSIFPSVDTCDASDGYLSLLLGNKEIVTLLETNISPYQGTVEDDVLFHQVGHVSSLESR